MDEVKLVKFCLYFEPLYLRFFYLYMSLERVDYKLF